MLKIYKSNRGAATVEFALIVTLFVTLLFGIVELGLIMKDYLTLGQAAREGARSASLGSPTSTINTRIQNSALTLNSSSITISLYKRSMSPSPGSWTPLGDSASSSSNDAISGDQVRIKLTYPHELVTGNLLSFLTGGGSSMNIGNEMVMRRE